MCMFFLWIQFVVAYLRNLTQLANLYDFVRFFWPIQKLAMALVTVNSLSSIQIINKKCKNSQHLRNWEWNKLTDKIMRGKMSGSLHSLKYPKFRQNNIIIQSNQACSILVLESSQVSKLVKVEEIKDCLFKPCKQLIPIK